MLNNNNNSNNNNTKSKTHKLIYKIAITKLGQI